MLFFPTGQKSCLYLCIISIIIVECLAREVHTEVIQECTLQIMH